MAKSSTERSREFRERKKSGFVLEVFKIRPEWKQAILDYIKGIEMKYYYKCPLQAAWMVHHYNMKFTTSEGVEVGVEIDAEFYEDGQVGYTKYGASEDNCRYFVHPDSYDILKPHVGDLISGNLLNRGKPEDVISYFTIYALPYGDNEGETFHMQPFKRSGSRNFVKSSVKIIQRRGKAFFTPLGMD